MTKRLSNKRILLGVTGGIAAYKSAEICRRLQDEGAEVRTAMTSAAQKFITPLTLQALSRNPVHLDLLDAQTESAMGHIEVARWADIILIAPASADFISRLAQGRSDDLLTAICLAADCKVVLAPSMNRSMWEKDATQNNICEIQKREIAILRPGEGDQACGEIGVGRLMEVGNIVNSVSEMFETCSLAGKHVVVTAGPTREAIDPVRYISNHSSGKQGYAIAEAAIEAGARVTLISGPTNLSVPSRVEIINIESAEEMLEKTLNLIETMDIFISVAAVADFKVETPAPSKIKKTGDPNLNLVLSRTPDILLEISKLNRRDLFTVGFAAETENLIGNAKKKLNEKSLNLIVANNIGDPEIGFDSDLNEVTVLGHHLCEKFPKSSKKNLARKLVAFIAKELRESEIYG
ncbi:MAG: bifunctional phosphopantothenoylcysteine decarboxylase/phosphopantothenate--cysteine ligase CoaBC [Gammaproteobacteria bacterium]|nr:bifunctional phosphopantothenoylcysteine decarboxylase/phosphopantothenate--cysteine ligase CoaBC [Gammaproteobacteria bacterium]